jgi:hypothetical protein
MFHTSEEAKFSFDIIEIFVPDTKTCIRLVWEGKIDLLDFIYLKITWKI